MEIRGERENQQPGGRTGRQLKIQADKTVRRVQVKGKVERKQIQAGKTCHQSLGPGGSVPTECRVRASVSIDQAGNGVRIQAERIQGQRVSNKVRARHGRRV